MWFTYFLSLIYQTGETHGIERPIIKENPKYKIQLMHLRLNVYVILSKWKRSLNGPFIATVLLLVIWLGHMSWLVAPQILPVNLISLSCRTEKCQWENQCAQKLQVYRSYYPITDPCYIPLHFQFFLCSFTSSVCLCISVY